MNEQEFQDALKAAFEELTCMADDDEYPDTLPAELAAIVEARTFRDAGVMTANKGLVITLDDGAQLQLTIVQSR